MADNWYVILELDFDPPIEDEKRIAQKIEEKSKFWSTNFNDFKTGAQYRTWHQNIPQIKKDMIGSQNIRQRLAKEACAIVYNPVDKYLKTIGRKGNITEKEGTGVAKKCAVSLDIVKKRATALGIKWVAESGPNYQSIYDKYYKMKPQNAAVYDGMKPMLSTFGVETLYDFLRTNTIEEDIEKVWSCSDFLQRASEKKKNEFYKHDAVSATGSRLCGQCQLVFENDNSKKLYDDYLLYNKIKFILDDAKNIAEISGELTLEQGMEIIGQLTQVLKDGTLAAEILTAFCKIEKISYNSRGTSEILTNIKVCRCGYMNDVSDGRKVCGNCGLPLVIKCPKCGRDNDSNIKVCKCTFQLENIDKALALCERAENAINTLDFTVAKVYLDDAERCWPHCNKLNPLRNHLNDYEERVGKEVSKMREAMKSKRYYEAENQYRSIQKLFSNYADILVEEEIHQAIDAAKTLYNQAKASKVHKEILELCTKAYERCSDFPGIREIMPKPSRLSGFRVTVNEKSRDNLISWNASSDRSIVYVIVRNQEMWVRNISDGKIIFRGSASSYVDSDIEAGRSYYYNVFAERAGLYSEGAVGNFQEIINLFEIRNVAITSSDGSLNINWDAVPPNATVELYEIQGNAIERHIASVFADHYLITGLKNDEIYRYRVSLSYMIAGKKRETKGITVSAAPTRPPLPIDSLRIKPLQEGQFEAVWHKPIIGEVRLYASTNKPEYRTGDAVAIAELERKMFLLQQKNLSPRTTVGLKKDETGAAFDYLGKDTLYVVAVAIKSVTAIFGNLARASTGETVKIKSIRVVNGKINIYIEPPVQATGFVVLYRLDQFPSDIGDVNSVRKYIPFKQYQMNSAIILDMSEERKYYFTVFAEFKQDSDKDYSAGSDYLFDNSPKLNITYSINVNKKLFGESSVILEFEADTREFALPDIELMSAIGNTPMFKASSKLFYTIEARRVSGSVQIRIPIPKNLPKETYIKAFFKDESEQNGNQLRLKLKSNYKIN